MQTIIEYARSEGIGAIEGQVLHVNSAMLQMCEQLGFAICHDPDDPQISVVKLSL
jgi:acetyltransferase